MKIIPIRANLAIVKLEKNNQLIVSYQTCVAATIDKESFKTEKRWSNTTMRHISDTGYESEPTKP